MKKGKRVKKVDNKNNNPNKIMATKRGRGLGVGGGPRFGRPKTDAERRREHKKKFGTAKLPPRGTGLRRRR